MLGEASPIGGSDNQEDVCLKYFSAQQAVRAADALKGYVASTDETSSAIAGFLRPIKLHEVNVN